MSLVALLLFFWTLCHCLANILISPECCSVVVGSLRNLANLAGELTVNVGTKTLDLGSNPHVHAVRVTQWVWKEPI